MTLLSFYEFLSLITFSFKIYELDWLTGSEVSQLILTQFCSSKDEIRIISENLRNTFSNYMIDQFYYVIIKL